MKSSRIILIIALILLFINVSNCQTYPRYFPFDYSIKAKVARVIDGDTFVLSDSQHVRILGVNTPEIAHLGKPAQPFADSASSFTKSLINGKNVKLKFACPSVAKRRRDQRTYDIFGRILAYVWLTNIKKVIWIMENR